MRFTIKLTLYLIQNDVDAVYQEQKLDRGQIAILNKFQFQEKKRLKRKTIKKIPAVQQAISSVTQNTKKLGTGIVFLCRKDTMLRK